MIFWIDGQPFRPGMTSPKHLFTWSSATLFWARYFHRPDAQTCLSPRAAGCSGIHWFHFYPHEAPAPLPGLLLRQQAFQNPTRVEIAQLVIDFTGLKDLVKGVEGKKYGHEKRRVWRKLHLAVDAETHEVICADLSLNNVTDAEAFPGFIRQTHKKIRAAWRWGLWHQTMPRRVEA